MKPYLIHLQGQREPLLVDLECDSISDLADLAAQSRFLIGHLTAPDEQGCCARVMIAAGRISCAVEISL
jgi:hypothetical protein